MDLTLPTVNLTMILPQVILVAVACLILLLNIFTEAIRRAAPYLSLVGIVLALVATQSQWGEVRTGFGDFIIADHFTLYANLIFLVGAGLTVLISVAYGQTRGLDRVEYYVSLLLATVGMSFMAASVNLLSFFLSLELLSIALYVLIAFERQALDANEAAIKYFILGAFAGAFALYGIALIYGATATLNYQEILAILNRRGLSEVNPLLLIGLGLILVGLGFKISMVPFHLWTPDVYEGAPTPVAAFLSTGSKAAALAVLVRVFSTAFMPLQVYWAPLIAALAVVTMTLGNLIALTQNNVKRMLAYSSIAHVGYILLALVAGGESGHSSILFYLLAYTFMNLAAFGVIALLNSGGVEGSHLDHFSGLGSAHPVLAAVMAIAMFSLGGIPPTVGFVAKFYVFSAAVQAGYGGLVVIAVLNSAISLYYYLRVVVVMYMREPASILARLTAGRLSVSGAVGICLAAFGILELGVLPGYFLKLAQHAVALLVIH